MISVIIPTARDSAALAPLLAALGPQLNDVGHDVSGEVIVVNDRPRMQRSDPAFCTVLRSEGKGPAYARNLGAAHARGTFLLFLDDDVMIDDSYLARIGAAIAARPGYAVSGMQMATDRGNSFSLASEWMLHLFVQSQRGAFAPSNPLALRRAEFERCGGFDPSFPLAAGEDREFCVRWTAAGFRIAILEEAAVQHRFPGTFSSLAKQQWRYGRGASHFYRRARAVDNLPRPIRYYFRMLIEAPRRYGIWRGLAVGILSWICQAILACGYLRERIWPAGETSSIEETCAQ